MKPKEVWSFPVGDEAGTQCLLRVMLAVADLELSADSLMWFVHDCLLVQLGQPGKLDPDEFASHVLIDGVFFANMPRIARRLGFRKVANVPTTVEDVALPCWLVQSSHDEVWFCQGEIKRLIRQPNPKALFEKWRIRNSPAFPAQLAPRVLPGGAQYDLRYNPRKEECMRELGVEVAPNYMSTLQQQNPNRREVYERAMRAGRPTKE